MPLFLNLPAELRFQIYGYMAVPYKTPFSSYIGLYQSCHQVKVEMDSECGKVLRTHLLDMQAQLPDSVIEIPDTFLEMQHIRLFLPDDPDVFCDIHNKLNHSFKLLFASITFIVNETHEPAEATGFLAFYFLMLVTRHLSCSTFRSGRVYFDTSTLSKISMKLLMLSIARFPVPAPQWSYGWLIKDGKPLGIWDRTSSKHPFEKMSGETIRRALQHLYADY